MFRYLLLNILKTRVDLDYHESEVREAINLYNDKAITPHIKFILSKSDIYVNFDILLNALTL